MCAAVMELLTATAALRLGMLEDESSFKLRATAREPSTTIAPIAIKQINTTAAAMKVLVRIVRRERNRDAGSLAVISMVSLVGSCFSANRKIIRGRPRLRRKNHPSFRRN